LLLGIGYWNWEACIYRTIGLQAVPVRQHWSDPNKRKEICI